MVGLFFFTDILAQTKHDSQFRGFLVVAAIVIITLLLIRSGRRRRQGGSPRQYRREIDGATQQSMAVKRDMERLLVELNELARQINGQIETRFAKLEQSISDADKRIKALRLLINAAQLVQSSDSTDPNQSHPPQNKSALPSDSAQGNLDIRITDGGISENVSPVSPTNHDATDKQESAHAAPLAEDQSTSEGSSEDDALHHRIYQMSDDGRTVVEIARELQHNIGEVELILNLRPHSER